MKTVIVTICVLFLMSKESETDEFSHGIYNFKIRYYENIEKFVENSTQCLVTSEGLHARKGLVSVVCPTASAAKLEALIDPSDIISKSSPEEMMDRNFHVFDEFIADKYRDFEEMERWLKQMDAEYSHVHLSIVGTSFEQKPIYLLQISPGQKNVAKPIIFIEAGAHAREWIAPAVAIALIDHLARLDGMNGM